MKIKSTKIHELLELTIKENASDLIITANNPPTIRVNGDIVPTEFEELTPEDTKTLVHSMLTEEQHQIFEKRKELDFSYDVPHLSRFRVNVHLQKNTVAAAFRPISTKIPSLEELNLPPIISELAFRPRGLILVTGPAGSGKSTTLAAMINLINTKRKCHIVTIEDPIEYMYENKQSLIEQREIYRDTLSFASALKHIVRQSPDVILVGEMRDLETMATAITAAETGHLVLATLHTIDAAQTIHRIIDVFPAQQQSQIRVQFAVSLQGIISQQLVPIKDKTGRIPAVEVLMATSAIKNLISVNDIQQIPLLIHTGKEYGMQSMNQALSDLFERKMITYDMALSRATNPAEFKRFATADAFELFKNKSMDLNFQ
jgi:twitching motility protein PilT